MKPKHLSILAVVLGTLCAAFAAAAFQSAKATAAMPFAAGGFDERWFWYPACAACVMWLLAAFRVFASEKKLGPLLLLLVWPDFPVPAAEPAQMKPHQSGTLAPDLAYLNLSNGQKASLKTHCGKIVVIEFWATWCAPCQPEMAEFQKLAAKFADKKDLIVFLTISIDGAERETKNPPPTPEVQQHLTKRGWTQAINGWSTFEERQPWDLHAVPITFIIGPDGKFIGDSSQDVEETITRLLTK